jgi:hypothetical protein
LEPERYDFIIRNDYCLDKKSKWINNKIIYRTLRDCGEYKPAAVSLLSFVVYYQNIMVDVQLQTEEYNYMITGNVIDKTFIYYLLKQMGIRVGTLSEFDYRVRMITGDVNILQMDSTQALRIQETTLVINNLY